MKFHFNPKYTQVAVYALIVVVLSGFLLLSISKFPDLGQMFETIGASLSPIIWGVVIAYLLNPLVEFFRTRVFKSRAEKAASVRRGVVIRNLSVVLTILLAVGLMIGLLYLIIPQVWRSLTGLVGQFGDYAERFMSWVYANFADQPQVISAFENPIEQIETYLNSSWTEISKTVFDFGSRIGGGAINFILAFKDFIIGFIIAIYFLISKETLKAQVKKILFAFFRNDRVQGILRVSRHTNDIFTHYITGTLIDAFFIGCVAFIGASLIGTPYPLLMAVIIGCTNIIPFFGPFIGAIPCCFFVLLEDPMKMVWFALFILILQQVDGNLLKPLLFGETMGLPAMWVLISIILGGGLFGFVGVLLGVPVFALIYTLTKELLENRLTKKGLPAEGALYNRDDVGKYTDGYRYTEEQRAADEKWLEANAEKKKTPRLLPIAEKAEEKVVETIRVKRTGTGKTDRGGSGERNDHNNMNNHNGSKKGTTKNERTASKH
ncbi:MAG: AI-2E family transporter [Bacteroides sp.]|nr:AI-2E family transporter [Eubacterium sp.]MCM1418680.1 AI-2E family transporter [Roseburia sp.]MCM1461984.1 AI-2E family transporter [Bacteroides sp.]